MIKLPDKTVKLYRVLDQPVEVHGYTAEQMRQAIRDALEEAAKVCDAHDYYGDPMAIEIRALKETI